MKIVAINGSFKRSGGRTEKTIQHIFEGAIENGAECKEIKLSTLNINRCICCNSCQRSVDYKCVYSDKDDFETVLNEINSSDIVMFCSPIYVFDMSSLMRIFIERIYGHGKSNKVKVTKYGLMFHDVDNKLLNKKIVNLVVSDNLENDTIQSVKNYWKSYSKFMDSEIVGYIERTSSFMLDDNSKYEKLKEDTIKYLRIAGSQLAKSENISKKVERKIAKRIIPLPYTLYHLLLKTKNGREAILNKIER